MLNAKQLATLRASDARNRVWVAMNLAGVTQVQVAEAIGMTQSHISRIANDNYSRLAYHTALRLAQYFGCAAEDLFPAREALAS